MRFLGRSVLGVDQIIFCARSHAHELHCGRLSSSYGYKFFCKCSIGYKCGFEKVVLILKYIAGTEISLRNSSNPARWFKQIERTVSFDVTARFNPIQQSTAMYSSHIFNGCNTTINDQLTHSKYTEVFRTILA